MTHGQITDDLTHHVCRALSCARRIRACEAEASSSGLDEGATRVLAGIVPVGGRDAFSETVVERLRAAAATLAIHVAAGTTVGVETYDAWDDRGAETTAVHRRTAMTPEAERLTTIIADLRQLAAHIETALDLVAAEKIVAALKAC